MIIASVTGMPAAQEAATILPEQPTQILQERKNKEAEIANSINIEAYVKKYFKDVPILAEVARCESHYRHTDKYGNVIRGKVNRSDVGVMQINEHYHSAKAKSLKLDLHTLDGNMAYALYLYEKEGARPWMASSACWSGAKELAKRDVQSNQI